MQNVTQQRIKYLVEHGEVYPVEKPLERALGVKLLALIALLQLVDIVLTAIR